ncbi:GGDEF domain-containing protein [Acinetobacter rongchengensis]|uniref:diguanylate cyclase n=1 Tax=Acinetobacter rongchengensis TaxID=2419601 RepID=A0A3A8EXL3_9GAMM|nr:GGDEF domain-containing protein [Acinetobacter rongchengensis]RKG38859.1 GGDEF domain-containing protein [Acinetobacter rongchengensis]
MEQKLRSEQISARLLIFMFVIILSVLLIAIPQIVQSYQEYVKLHRSLVDIQNLRIFAETSNKISRERAPSNKAMASSREELPIRIKELKEYREGVNKQIDLTVHTLQQAGFPALAKQVDVQLRNDLNFARKQVDSYIATPKDARKSIVMDHAIRDMFHAWDGCRAILQQLIIDSKQKNSEVTDYASIVLILADLRDQAGRVASNIMAPLSFAEPIPEFNKIRSLQTQEQVKYLWRLMDTIQPESLKTTKYLELHEQVKLRFIDQALPIVNQLILQSENKQAYSLNANQVTDAMVDKFTSIIDLQAYLLEMHSLEAQRQMQSAQHQFFLILLISILLLTVAFFTMLYTRRKLFEPLIQAQHMIEELFQIYERDQADIVVSQNKEAYNLTDAIDKLKEMLRQRDILEFQLKNIANTDSLSGVSNRLGLEAYLKNAQAKPNQFQKLSLIIVDIDNFKRVNDQFGHILGDLVIVEIAQCLKANISQTDLIVRFGGDEFLILIANSERNWILQIAESILADVSRLQIALPASSEKLKVSVSIGVATGAENWEALFSRADASLFKAKTQGRNKVVG